MSGLASRLAALTGWRRYGVALAAGALASTALPPGALASVGVPHLYLLPLLIPAFVALVWLNDGSRRRRAAYFVGFCFAFGFFLCGLYWIGFALLVDAARHAWLLPLAVLGLPLLLALFHGLATLAGYLLELRGGARVLALALAWTAAEWLRGHLFTGFPWNLMGYVWTASDEMLQFAALFGIYGLSFVTIACGGAAATLVAPAGARIGRRGWALPLAAVALLLLMWLGGAARLPGPGDKSASVPEVRLRLVQANLSQADKWRADLRESNLGRHLQLSSGPGSEAVSHIIWPETAVPYFLQRDKAAAALVGGLVGPSGLVLSGGLRAAPDAAGERRIWNSLLALDASGSVVATYDKAHLVPFGEYLPLAPVLARLGFSKLAPGAAGFAAGTGRQSLTVGGLPPFSPLICYEVIFPSEVVKSGARPSWLLNLTNDAWYGRSAGPYQHFAMARVRAVEEGLPLVRVANTGISGVVDGYGRVLRRLGLGQAGVIDSPLPQALAAPPYARFGDVGLGLLLALVMLCLGWLERRRRRAAPRDQS